MPARPPGSTVGTLPKRRHVGDLGAKEVAHLGEGGATVIAGAQYHHAADVLGCGVGLHVKKECVGCGHETRPRQAGPARRKVSETSKAHY
jgi:hypothetical protein